MGFRIKHSIKPVNKNNLTIARKLAKRAGGTVHIENGKILVIKWGMP